MSKARLPIRVELCSLNCSHPTSIAYIGNVNSYATSNSSNETINDEPQLGTVIVTKHVINEGGGSARPSDFTITVDGNNPTPASFDGSSSGTTVQLLDGRYTVTESGSTSNYDSTLSRGCSGNMRAGENKVCYYYQHIFCITSPYYNW